MGPKLDALITEVLGCLHYAELIDFDHVAQDGIRVRASAGAASFRREASLQHSLEEAQAVLAAVQAADAEDGAAQEQAAPTLRQRAARQRAAQERVARVEAALAAVPAVQATKRADKKEEARVSTTDPEARVMKMADGGYRPAYNIQLAADSGHQVIVGVDVTTTGSDQQQAPPMVQQVKERLDALPEHWLMDGGFAAHAAIEQVEAVGPQVLAPCDSPKTASATAMRPALRTPRRSPPGGNGWAPTWPTTPTGSGQRRLNVSMRRPAAALACSNCASVVCARCAAWLCGSP